MNMDNLKRADIAFILQKTNISQTFFKSNVKIVREQYINSVLSLFLRLYQTRPETSALLQNLKPPTHTASTHMKEEGPNQEETGSMLCHFFSSMKLRKSSLVLAP